VGYPDLTETLSQEQLERVRAYCTEMCPGDFVEDATAAALLDFRARAGTAGPTDDVDELLARSIRSAAAARADPRVGSATSPGPECLAMPELLAARANNELPGDDRVIRQHLNECIVCETTFARMRRAEQILAVAGGFDESAEAVAEAKPEAVAEAEAEPAPGPRAPSPPTPPAPPPPSATPGPPTAPPPPTIVVRRRSGGLVGAVRKAARNAMR
jgi:hypothetical protein